ncbi:MAG: hypothetical protein JHC93_04735 [Parachlamydiales bacterium]|nr:hypothetical protein [Parachlamydiales bacterium]
MKKKRAAIMCSQGLGDGIIYSMIAYNLYLIGYEVTVYSQKLLGLKSWFPNQIIKPYVTKEEWDNTLNLYDIVVIQPGALPYTKFQLIPKTLPKHVLFMHNHEFDYKKSLVANLLDALKTRFKCQYPTRYNGISPPQNRSPARYSKRVVIHATSGEEFRNWPVKKYEDIARYITKTGYEPVFVMCSNERKEFLNQNPSFKYQVPDFANLDELTGFIYESKYFIGNDSGLGHLASSLGLPTITLFHSPKIRHFWRPGWSKNYNVCPLPILFKYKWQKRFWKHFLFPFQVIDKFKKMIDNS